MKNIYETCTLLFKQDGFWNREVLMRKDNATHTILNDLADILVYGIIFNFHTVIYIRLWSDYIKIFKDL